MYKRILGAAIAAATFGAAAQAAVFTGSYTINNYTSGNAGLATTVIDRTDSASLTATDGTTGDRSFSFSLAQGETKLFNLFDIFTTETYANADDFFAQAMTAAFGFTAPAPAFGGNATGETSAALFLASDGLRSRGSLDWDDNGVTLFQFGTIGDGLLELTLTDALYNAGTADISRFVNIADIGDLDPGAARRASVTAQFRLLRDATEVPEPGMIGLLGLGVLGLAVARRRRA